MTDTKFNQIKEAVKDMTKKERFMYFGKHLNGFEFINYEERTN